MKLRPSNTDPSGLFWAVIGCLAFWFCAVMFILFATRARGGEVTIAWDAQPATEFRVWKGIDLLATVPTNTATITLPDAPCSITVTARNAGGESPHSEPLHLVAVRIQESTNLKAWWYAKTIHRERKPAMFYRLEILP
jgi:hypothetical protein